MQDAAGNIFVDRSGMWIRRHSHHSVINILAGKVSGSDLNKASVN